MERPRLPRRSPAREEPISRVRLRTGHDFFVIDASDSGVLVEGTRLLPGTHVDVHVVTRDGRVLVRSRVVRAYVYDLRADAVLYRIALTFDRVVDTAAIGYAIPEGPLALVAEPGRPYPLAPHDVADASRQRLSA